MYDNHFPNDNHSDKENETPNTALNTTGGRFSSQTSPTAYGSTNPDNHYYANTGNANRNYGYGAGAYQNASREQTAGSYQYGNTYPNDYGQIKPEKKKKEKKGAGSYFKKALVSVSLGLFFGLCAGIGLYAVESATGMLERNAASNTTAVQMTEEIREEADEVKEAASNAVETLQESASDSEIEKTQTVYAVVSDVSDVVSAVMPAVVSISNTYTETMSYFGQSMSSEAVASGSGIIVGENDTELLIVTNYHVIADADKLMVQFVEGSEAEASVKGTDADMDLAIIAVPLTDVSGTTLNQIAIATLGDSNDLKVGEPAIAIGNSLGYGQSVTTGVISALNRDMELSDGSTGTFIQTDAAINPGNSGGALLNIKGEVIGINSNKIGGSVVEGMGYAIPISAASPIIADLMLRETKNKVSEEERGFLGISGISVTAEVSSTYGMPEGVYIAQVYEGTAAAAAGLQKGDIINSFDGVKITSMDELQKLLEYYAKGDTVDLTVMTIADGGYRSKTVSITLGNKVEQ
ncbi:MAG: trypsin-like peptidase domain-containing protein [Eubacterium sp.]|nr:trypsin-like peptidase domain-containing protein [Eubacterium sp.]